MSNKFAKQLPAADERKHRLYLLDTDPVHTLQIFCVPQYLPSNIYGYNSVSTDDLVHHHKRVTEGIQEDSFTFGFDEAGIEKSLAFVFGIDIPSKTLAEQPKKIRCLQIYYQAPVVEDIPPGVFGVEEGPEKTQWSELPSSNTQAGKHNRLFQHSYKPPSGAAAAPPSDMEEDGLTCWNTLQESPAKASRRKSP
jgi:hypothetical protein